ncbi:nickel pincer cofactor biosynthesis protein LarC [candidate division NPL-UPA2 bacterium]|nr:nickel pincer cofactor biosynthesis protein LarC [candidate division NPL-UPA2 bacterium]
MRIAYFDCFSGISGDMILGALIDAGLKIKVLQEELKKLGLRGYQIKAGKVKRQNLAGRQFSVEVAKAEIKERNLSEILSLLQKSRLARDIKERSQDTFKRLGEAEDRVHRMKGGESHFHEVGAIDSIIDVVGAVIGLKILRVEKVYSSPLSLGRGWVEVEGGRLPVPVPATLELVKNIPVSFSDENHELVTPTGAAIITTVAENFGEVPPLKIQSIGYGAGRRRLSSRPNLLRVLIGQSIIDYERDEVVVIESNVDDMNPQIYDYLQERLFEAGALDVFLTSAWMKKSRPGILFTILAEKAKVEDLVNIIFTETPSLGLRTYPVRRYKLPRRIKEVRTKYGKIKVKIAKIGEIIKQVSPEYEDCKKIAKKKGISFQTVYEEAKKKGEILQESINFPGLGGTGETIWFPPWGDRRVRRTRRPRGGAP